MNKAINTRNISVPKSNHTQVKVRSLFHVCRCVETPSFILKCTPKFSLTTCQFTAAAYGKTKFLHRRRKCRKWCSVGLSRNFQFFNKVTYLSHALCHAQSATFGISSTVQILKSSAIHEKFIK